MNVLPIFKNHYEAISVLPADTQGEIYRAITAYAFNDEIIEMSAVAEAIFLMIKPSIDVSKAKAEAGQKGGKVKAEPKQTESKTEANAKQTPSKAEAYEILNINNKTLDIKTNTPRASERDFSEIWSLYPRKEGRSQALEAYKRAIHNGVTKDTILQGVKRYADYVRQKQTETRYIKQGSTWFRNKCWEDDLDFTIPKQESQYMQRTDPMDGILMDL